MRNKYLIVILIAFMLCITGCNKSSSIENYLNSGTTIDINAKDIMPNLDELPEYENITYKYTHKTMLIFESDSVALIVKYDDETYQSEKNKLAENYIFLEDNVEDVIPEYEFSINSYTFKVVADNENSNTEFPKSFGMIGTSEEEKSIAYLYFYDYDLDYIGEEDDRNPMANFVKEYFKYEF